VPRGVTPYEMSAFHREPKRLVKTVALQLIHPLAFFAYFAMGQSMAGVWGGSAHVGANQNSIASYRRYTIHTNLSVDW
ncbi:MAG: hypothetical protein IIV85_02210, partial [Clostridia bacterium]|nr:hypothetical protein [Clostridia bacterium]